MPNYLPAVLISLLVMLCSCETYGADEAKGPAAPAKLPPKAAIAKSKSVEQIAETVRKSVVVISITGRDGKRQGLGTGFVVGADGLIATNLHVIAEGRPITVELADGKRYPVTMVEASDRQLDLALVRIDVKNLAVLALGNSSLLKQGQSVVAIGNPHGLERSVVSGVVSGTREIEGRNMIQLAIPLEPGNSGGPLVDMLGQVQGILTMKSLVTSNLGFAVGINSLKPLLQKPNPVPMSHWLTIGTLDSQEWKLLFGGGWRQRAGHIMVSGAGTGFGGRSLCLSRLPVPALPFEVAVTVRLDDESGAAGLVFYADGHHKHYGFYPTSGRLRLTRFDGPDVFSWKILKQEPSAYYRAGEWNMLKVRLEKEKIYCYVNDHLVFESTDSGLTSGQVGLAKFRDTQAEFKWFRIGLKLPSANSPAEVVKRVSNLVKNLPQNGVLPGQINALLPDAQAAVTVLRDRAKMLEEQAKQLRKLAATLHQKRVQSDLAAVLREGEDQIDMLKAALLIAKLDNDEIDVDGYQKEFERLTREFSAGLPKDANDKAKLAGLNKFLFHERGFHGSRLDYYNKANSYLNEVLDDREGLPITLSVVYMELARRVGLKVVGVGLPGHFVVKYVPAQGEAQLVDVYEGGQILSRDDASRKVLAMAGRPLEDEDLKPVSKKVIVIRMVHNLLGIARTQRDSDGVLRYLDTILALQPDAAQERMARALLRFQTGQREGAIEDADWLLEHQPAGLDADRLSEFRRMLERPGSE